MDKELQVDANSGCLTNTNTASKQSIYVISTIDYWADHISDKNNGKSAYFSPVQSSSR